MPIPSQHIYIGIPKQICYNYVMDTVYIMNI